MVRRDHRIQLDGPTGSSLSPFLRALVFVRAFEMSNCRIMAERSSVVVGGSSGPLGDEEVTHGGEYAILTWS
jgi:hypothetical protein